MVPVTRGRPAVVPTSAGTHEPRTIARRPYIRSYPRLADDPREVARRLAGGCPYSNSSKIMDAVRFQEKRAACSNPRRTIMPHNALSVATRPMASARAPVSVGLTSRPACPATSGRLLVSLATTGVPQPMASSTGSPNPSYSDG